MSLSMNHPGGWCPFPGFCTNRMPNGYFEMNPLVGSNTGTSDGALSDSDAVTTSRRQLWLREGEKAFQYFTVSQVFNKPLELLTPSIKITQGREPEQMQNGPTVTIEIYQRVKFGDPSLTAAFRGAVCIYLDSSPKCLDVEVLTAFGPETKTVGVKKETRYKFNGFTLKGTYNQGDLYPLAAVLPDDMKDMVIIRGSVEEPLTLEFTVDPKHPTEMEFELGTMLSFRPPSLFNLGDINIPLVAQGLLRAGGPPCAAFRTRGPLPDIELPGGITIPGFYIALVTPCPGGVKKPKAKRSRKSGSRGLMEGWAAEAHAERTVRHLSAGGDMDGDMDGDTDEQLESGTGVNLPPGITYHYKGSTGGRSLTEEWAAEAPPERAVRHLAMGQDMEVMLESGTVINLPPGITFVYEGDSFMPEVCPLSMVISLSMTSMKQFRIEAACVGMTLKMLHKKPLMLPSINHLMFTSMALFVEMAGPPPTFTFGFSTSFELATGKSYCERAPAVLTDGADYPIWDSSECITAELTVSIAKDPAFIIIGMSLLTSGAWLEPLGLRNFAIVNTAFEFEIQITTTIPPIPTPKKLAFAMAIYWKKDPDYNWENWPLALRYKTDGWPPQGIDLIQYKMRTLQVFFLYEQWHPGLEDCAHAASRTHALPLTLVPSSSACAQLALAPTL